MTWRGGGDLSDMEGGGTSVTWRGGDISDVECVGGGGDISDVEGGGPQGR